MNPDHEPTLAAIEQLAIAQGIPTGDADAYIADELRVPFDHYAPTSSYGARSRPTG